MNEEKMKVIFFVFHFFDIHPIGRTNQPNVIIVKFKMKEEKKKKNIYTGKRFQCSSVISFTLVSKKHIQKKI